MELYDVYAPIGEEGKMSYAQAMQDIMASLESYPAFGKHVTTLYDAKRLDTVFHPKKRAGAYNYGLPHNLMPFVFMQYLGKERDASTLAHELGHAVHAMYTKELTTNSYHSSIGIAESASTFFEELLFTQQLNKAPATQKISLLINHLTDSFSTIIRQAYINEFELQAHAKVEEGTTKSELHALWARLQKEQFGEAVAIPESSLSWTYVPHIYHTPFYCYNYALGNLLALMLVGSDQKKLEQYLSVGGTMDTLQTAKLMNIDLEDPQVYERAFAKLKERIDLLKSLVR
jgi:oligoendopeptidase F